MSPRLTNYKKFQKPIDSLENPKIITKTLDLNSENLLSRVLIYLFKTN